MVSVRVDNLPRRMRLSPKAAIREVSDSVGIPNDFLLVIRRARFMAFWFPPARLFSMSRRESGSDSGPNAGDAGKCTLKVNYQDNAWPNLGPKFDPAADAAVSGIILLRNCSQKRVAHIQITKGRGNNIVCCIVFVCVGRTGGCLKQNNTARRFKSADEGGCEIVTREAPSRLVFQAS
jgi:hypothetical protein